VFRSAYINVFDFVLGNTGFDAAAIRHQPSTSQILAAGLQRSARSLSNLAGLLEGGGRRSSTNGNLAGLSESSSGAATPNGGSNGGSGHHAAESLGEDAPVGDGSTVEPDTSTKVLQTHQPQHPDAASGLAG
jgi:hypothetical protein